MSVMNRIIGISTLSFLMILPLATASYSQDDTGAKSFEKSINLEFALGFNTFHLSDAKDYHEATIDFYRLQNIPMQVQRNFSGNLLLGLNGLYRLSPQISVGLGTRYTSSPAKSKYKDYSGELEVAGSIRMLTAEGMAKMDLQKSGSIHPFFGIRGGFVFGFSKFTEKLSSDSYPGLKFDVELDGHGLGYTTEVFIGASRGMGRFDLQLQAGYRYAMVKEMDATLWVDGVDSGSGTLDMKFDYSGAILLATISLPL